MGLASVAVLRYTPLVHATDDLRIEAIHPLIPPAILLEEVPLSERASETVAETRRGAAAIIRGEQDRTLVVVGPCSIHDPAAGMEYARKLKAEAERFADDLLVVMRVYFEKPRTTVGWKGLINDPRLDGTFRINEGLRLARKLLLEVNELGLGAATEFLDVITPQFTADLVSWGAIGARTTESQVHRELASGLSVPVGFKNGTDGRVRIAIDAVKAAMSPHQFLSVTKQGLAAIIRTKGNDACHIILRGANSGPNYDAASVEVAAKELEKDGLSPRLMVDCSHGNSSKDHRRQSVVAADLATQIEAGSRAVYGVMIESNLVAGKQDIVAGRAPTYGQSITDACIAFDETVPVLEQLAAATRKRRLAKS